MKTMYQTGDGEIFNNVQAAVAHEKELFKTRLDDTVLIDLALLIECTDDTTKDEFWGTERDFLFSILKHYLNEEPITVKKVYED